MSHEVWPTGHAALLEPMRESLGVRPGDGVELFEQDGDIVRKAHLTGRDVVPRSDR
jgi:bifunctional DNA-binding transcriptional regulator/antitoxin component of YhaV-PrlF toxin-antitoxin module